MNYKYLKNLTKTSADYYVYGDTSVILDTIPC